MEKVKPSRGIWNTGERGTTLLNSVAREGLPEKGTFEYEPESGRGMHGANWGTACWKGEQQ